MRRTHSTSFSNTTRHLPRHPAILRLACASDRTAPWASSPDPGSGEGRLVIEPVQPYGSELSTRAVQGIQAEFRRPLVQDSTRSQHKAAFKVLKAVCTHSVSYVGSSSSVAQGVDVAICFLAQMSIIITGLVKLSSCCSRSPASP